MMELVIGDWISQENYKEIQKISVLYLRTPST